MATAKTNAVQITPAFVNALAEEARTNNPSLRAAVARAEAAAANIVTVPTWEDPTVRLGVMGAETSMRREDGDLLYGVEQKLPLWGKPQAARRMAQAGARVAQTEAARNFQEFRRDLAKAVFQTALARRVVDLREEDLRWLETLLRASEQRLQTGGASQAEVLRLQNERDRISNQLQTDAQLLGQQEFKLNRLLNRNPESPWPALQLPDIARPVVFGDRLVDLTLKYSPELQERRDEVGEAETAVDAARRQKLPDLSLGAEARNYSGNGDFRQSMVTLSVNVPWGNRKRYDAAVRRESQRLESRRLTVADATLALRNEVHALTVMIDAARRQALLYRDTIVPRSRAAVESARLAWESGQGQFRDVLDAHRMLADAAQLQARAVAEQWQALADLILCCGLGDLEALEMIGDPLEKAKEEKSK